MNTSELTSELVRLGKKELIENPYDQGHELLHHYSVWDNSIQILLEEKLRNVDIGLLQIAVWWHDIDRKDKSCPRLRKYSIELGLEDAKFEEILSVINSHSYADERSSIVEAKILFDADKIEYANPTRWIMVNEAVEKGEMKLEKGLKYCHALNNRISYVFENLNYGWSKGKLTENIMHLIELKEQDLLNEKFSESIDFDLLSRISNTKK